MRCLTHRLTRNKSDVFNDEITRPHAFEDEDEEGDFQDIQRIA
jgi:hypothetical protein